MLYKEWRCRLVENSDISGGELVYPNSRVSVKRVLSLLLQEVDVKTILEDYPCLCHEDIVQTILFSLYEKE
jgi:uncharacterized protein (DUF433 family)